MGLGWGGVRRFALKRSVTVPLGVSVPELVAEGVPLCVPLGVAVSVRVPEGVDVHSRQNARGRRWRCAPRLDTITHRETGKGDRDAEGRAAGGQRARMSSLSVIVIGASGDLANKKTFPALYELYLTGLLPPSAWHWFHQY